MYTLVYSVLCAVQHAVQYIHCIIILYKLFTTPRFIITIVLIIYFSIECTMHMYIVHCTAYTAVYTVHCTMYIPVHYNASGVILG